MEELYVDTVYPKNGKHPMVIEFQNGYTTEQFTSQECLLLDNSKSESKTLATEIDGVVYAGEEVNEELGRTYILTRNRRTGKVRLIETGVANLKPFLKISDSEAVSDTLDTSMLELSRKFGSKKHKQKMEQYAKLKVNVETVTEQMANITQEITEDTLDLSSYNNTTSDDFYVPPIDRNADTAGHVYDINSILTEEQYEKILSELQAKDYKSELLPITKSFVPKTSMSAKFKVLLVYANSLLQLFGTPVREIVKKSFVICPFSSTLNDIIINNFIEISNGRRTRPTPFKDKSLCHAIVFLLLISNLKIDFEQLCEAVKMTATTVSNKVRVTGASVVNVGGKKHIHLKLPLNKFNFRRKSAKF